VVNSPSSSGTSTIEQHTLTTGAEIHASSYHIKVIRYIT
jgi:hypothetical protein